MSWNLALDPSGLPVIDSPDGEDGLIRIAFKVMRIARNRHGFRSLECSGIYCGEPVDIALAMKEGMGRGVTQSATGTLYHAEEVHSGGVVLQRTGVTSDRLVTALADLFDLPHPDAGLEHISPFTCTAVAGDPTDDRSDVIYNLVTMTDERDKRGELYLQLRLTHGLIVLREKNLIHRQALLGYLSESVEAAESADSIV